jgi:hypothetical protein
MQLKGRKIWVEFTYEKVRRGVQDRSVLYYTISMACRLMCKQTFGKMCNALNIQVNKALVAYYF